MPATIIAENQTGANIFLSRLGVTVPASSSITLTDFLFDYEVKGDSQLEEEVSLDNILLNVGTGTLTKEESLNVIRDNNALASDLSTVDDYASPALSRIVRIRSNGATEIFNTIGEALATSISGDIVELPIGNYAESITIPDQVEIQGAYGFSATKITGASSSGTRVTLGSGSSIKNVFVSMPNDSNPGIFIPNTSIGSSAENIRLEGTGSNGIGIKSQGNGVILRNLRYIGGDCDTILEIDGGVTITDGFWTLSGTANNVVKIDNYGELNSNEVYCTEQFSGTDFVNIDDGYLLLYDSFCAGVDNSLHITSNNSELSILTLSSNSNNFDILCDPGVTNSKINLLNSALRIDKISANTDLLSNGSTTLSFQDQKLDDEGFKILGELQVGFPEQGKQTVLGQGDSYTRGVRVFTTDSTATSTNDGGNITDVTEIARSPDGSSFSFQGSSANHTILFTSELRDSFNYLKFFGIKVNIITGAVVGFGGTHDSFAIEYWNGSQWVEVDTFATHATKFYRYADELFLRSSNPEHIRFGINTNTTFFPWATKSILGVVGYWMRIRIKTTITTSPVFEQLKVSPSLTEISSDGTISYQGEARYRTTLLGAGNIFGESGGVVSVNPNIGSGGIPTGWSHNVKNSFLNSSGDAIYLQVPIQRGACTSCPWSVDVIIISGSNASDVQLTCSFLPREVVGVLEADPSGGILPVPRSAANTHVVTSDPSSFQTKTLSLVADKLYKLNFFPFSVKKYYEGDLVFIRLELNDDGPDNANILVSSVEVVGVLWTPGEHT